jgi:nucleotide-binding universal stress UspA family protein
MTQTIVVGTDGSGPADRAVRDAIDLAAREGAQLHVVTAYPDPAAFHEHIATGATRLDVDLRSVAESVAARRVQEATGRGLSVETHAREGHPAEVILAVASEVKADLIVVGSRGLTAAQRFLLGSVSQRVAEHADCNVMIVRND